MVKTSRLASRLFVPIYAALVLFGAICSVDLAWELADLAIGLMTVINLPILCLMSGEVKRESRGLMGRM